MNVGVLLYLYFLQLLSLSFFPLLALFLQTKLLFMAAYVSKFPFSTLILLVWLQF